MACLFVLVQEIVPFLRSAPTTAARFERLEQALPPFGLSISSRTQVLNDCIDAINSPYGRVQPTGRRTAVLGNCRQTGLAIARTSPSNAMAYFVVALSAAGLGQLDVFNAYLVGSQRLAPNEQYLAELRVDLAEAHFDRLDPAAKQAEEKDLILLAKSGRGVRSIAWRYVSQPKFRARIVSLVETLSPEVQKRFLFYVKAAAAQLGAR